jgi:hypothetical protein
MVCILNRIQSRIERRVGGEGRLLVLLKVLENLIKRQIAGEKKP